MAPAVDLTWAATPALPLPPTPVGQLTVVPAPTFDFQSGFTAARYCVRIPVVPLPSERWTTVVLRCGRFTPELSALICGSSQNLKVPRKILAMMGPDNLT